MLPNRHMVQVSFHILKLKLILKVLVEFVGTCQTQPPPNVRGIRLLSGLRLRMTTTYANSTNISRIQVTRSVLRINKVNSAGKGYKVSAIIARLQETSLVIKNSSTRFLACLGYSTRLEVSYSYKVTLHNHLSSTNS